MVIPHLCGFLAHVAAGYRADRDKAKYARSRPSACGETRSGATDPTANANACVVRHLRLRG
ncbi:hypothetical protein [Lysobacter gummosus]|uniref:hypothetical protein n=1 Tax=Lysobacter gummosus TaxID=262324 RepID=UPI00363AB2CF